MKAQAQTLENPLRHFRLFAAAAAMALLMAWSAQARASETDDRIEVSFKNSYVFRTYLKDDGVKINSKDGVVVLSGNVDFAGDRMMAQDTAEALPGVVRVENRLEVGEKEPLAETDAVIGMKVKGTLMFHRHVNAVKTDVTVNDGHVTLRGEAESQAQKDLTGEYAGDIEGVKSVRNEMTVMEGPPKPGQRLAELIDDASITAQVKGALVAHRSTSAIRTKVVTNDGVVTVSGMAKNPAEKELVGKIVEDINGVKKVVNAMTIAEKR